MHNKVLIIALIVILAGVAGWLLYVEMRKPDYEAVPGTGYPTKFFDDDGTEMATPTQIPGQPTGTIGTSVQDMSNELQGTVDDAGEREVDQVMKESEGL